MFHEEEKNEVTMLIVGCGNEVAIIFDEDRPARGWGFPSARVAGTQDPQERAVEAAKKKIGIDVNGCRIVFVKAKEKGGQTFSSFFVELPRIEFENLPTRGPSGQVHVRKINKNELHLFLDRGRYDMAVARCTRVPDWGQVASW